MLKGKWVEKEPIWSISREGKTPLWQTVKVPKNTEGLRMSSFGGADRGIDLSRTVKRKDHLKGFTESRNEGTFSRGERIGFPEQGGPNPPKEVKENKRRGP